MGKDALQCPPSQAGQLLLVGGSWGWGDRSLSAVQTEALRKGAAVLRLPTHAYVLVMLKSVVLL